MLHILPETVFIVLAMICHSSKIIVVVNNDSKHRSDDVAEFGIDPWLHEVCIRSSIDAKGMSAHHISSSESLNDDFLFKTVNGLKSLLILAALHFLNVIIKHHES